MKPISQRFFSVILLCLFALAACETRAPRPEGERPAEAPAKAPASVSIAEQAEQSGEFVVAAREYNSLAKQATTPQREHYALKAIGALIRAGQAREARDQLSAIKVDKLDISLQTRKRIHEAQLSVIEGKPNDALRQLAAAEKTPNLNPDLIAEILRVRAQSESALDRPVNAVKTLLARERVLVARDDLLKNQQALWQILEALSRTQLELEIKVSRDPVLTGWLELAVTALENAGSRSALANAVAAWRNAHATHPVTDEFLKTLGRPRPGQVGRVERIALLLPLTSDYAAAAAAVREGFVSMSAADRNPDKPQVRVVDIGGDPAKAVSAWQQAVTDGAQLIVGPLGLEAVDNVARKTSLEVPTLLLSHATDEINATNRAVFQFGLTPEQEATQVAERAWLDGHRQAAVLYSNTGFGRRMQTAFTAAWQRLGGLVVGEQEYLADQHDYSEPVKRLLNIVQSEARKDRLENVVKMKLKLEERPREDIDFIFLAADAKHARLIKPQLSYHHAARVPVYATSQVFTGRGDPALDTDLDGILFGDMPWMLVGSGRISELRNSLQSNWPYAHTGLDRLFALGVDAYTIIPQLDRLGSENALRFEGVTSGLSVGRGGRLHRQLLWAQFRKGVPVLVDTFLPYKGQFEPEPGTRPGG